MTEPKQQEEKLFLPDPGHERIVIVVRAVCGAVAGVLVAGLLWLSFQEELGHTLIVVLFVALLAAFACWAARQGDLFWERTLNKWLW